MFKLFSKTKQDVNARADFSFAGTDMHSHLLPGIDDGSPDLETSVKLIKGMMALGFKKFITTPHIMWEMYKNTPEIIGGKLELLRKRLKEEGINVEINAAAEYFLDDHVEGLLKRNEKLLTIKDNWVLSEFSLASAPHGLKDILFEMQMQGYQPVIAHPERYTYLEGNKTFYEDLKDIGCLFQLNILSLAGYYGKSAQELAHHLIKKGYYDLVGTDLHHARHLEALRSGAAAHILQKLYESGKIMNASI
jgi:tyrosine-protein phosphatase YwqE